MIRLAPRFAELAATTNFSFLRGASHPEEMVARAAELGLTGLGIADRNTLAGVVRAHVFARENRAAIGALRVVTGARLVFTDGAPDCSPIPRTAPPTAGCAGCSPREICARRRASAISIFADALEHARGLARHRACPAARTSARATRSNCARRSARGSGSARASIYGEDMRGALAQARRARARNPRAADRDQRCADACRPSGARSPTSSPASARA